MRTNELYQRYYGLYIGTVVDVKDPEQIGRIRLECAQFTDDAKNDPLWATVCRPGGGATSVFFTPNEGDQVIFGFEVGDVNGPVILGYAHNSKNQKPPEEVSADQKKHGIVTAIGSLIFDEDQKQIVLTFKGSSGDSVITIDDNGITLSTQGSVLIGDKNAGQHIPLGDKLVDWLRNHTHPTAMGPTTFPIESATLPTTLSGRHKVDS
jgi:phage baseplate assembly protein gpV